MNRKGDEFAVSDAIFAVAILALFCIMIFMFIDLKKAGNEAAVESVALESESVYSLLTLLQMPYGSFTVGRGLTDQLILGEGFDINPSSDTSLSSIISVYLDDNLNTAEVQYYVELLDSSTGESWQKFYGSSPPSSCSTVEPMASVRLPIISGDVVDTLPHSVRLVRCSQ